MIRQTVRIFAFLLLTSTACSRYDQQQADPTELMNADRDFAKATSLKGIEGWVEFFAENGAMLPDGLPITRGKTAIRRLMTPAFADENYTLVWEPAEADMSASADLGYTIGRYESTTTAPDGTKTTTVGKYVTIWKKQTDGTWKVVVDIGTPNERRSPIRDRSQ